MAEGNINENNINEYYTLSLESDDMRVKSYTLILLELFNIKDVISLVTLLEIEENKNLAKKRLEAIEGVKSVEIINDPNLSYRGFYSIAIELMRVDDIKKKIYAFTSSTTFINTNKYPEVEEPVIKVNETLTTPVKSTLAPLYPEINKKLDEINVTPNFKTPSMPLPEPPRVKVNPPLTTPIEATLSVEPLVKKEIYENDTMIALGFLVFGLVILGTLIR